MRVGFVGFGNMGRAIAEGLLLSGKFSKENLLVSVKSESSKENLKKEGFRVLNPKEVVKKSDVLLLAVKPKDLPKVAEEISDLTEGKILISVLAGVELRKLESAFPKAKVVRTMPNINAAVGKGVWGIAFGKGLTEKDKEEVKELLGLTGLVLEVDEGLMDAITALAGSGPAFVAEIIDAFAEAGVKLGFKYTDALKIVLYTVGGTVETLLRKGEHPILFRDRITSPGGTTVYGLSVLQKGLKGGIIEAVEAAHRRAKNIG